MREQEAIFDEVLYEADLVAREQYVVRMAVESNVLQIARNLKRDNFPLDAIMRNTCLPIEVIESL
jgi:hypothetical protein